MPQVEYSLKTNDGLTLYGLNWLPEGEPRSAVCLIHGLGEHIRRYDHVAEAFNQVGLGLIGFDLRGHGRSEGPRGHSPSFDQLMDDISQFLEEAGRRYPGKPRFLYGHSLGGLLALDYAFLRRPDLAGLIVTSPGLMPGTPVPGWKTTIARILYKATPGFSLANGLDLSSLSNDPDTKTVYLNDPLVHDKISARMGLDLLNTGLWISQQKGPAPLPMLIMHGKDDRIASAAATEQFAKSLSGDVTTRIWSDMVHEIHNEVKKKDVLDAMVGWISHHLN
jgi:acylglycerol lipase